MMSNTQHYDIIFAGAGLAGLSTAVAMVQHPFFAHKKIALVDRDSKNTNDRTWCFWANTEEIALLPPVLFRSWPHMQFHSPIHSQILSTQGYNYNMVRGLDFYQWAKSQLQQHPNITWINDTIQSIDPNAGIVRTETHTLHGDWILNSALTPFPLVPAYNKDHFSAPFTPVQPTTAAGYTYLLQHFKGWIIRTEQPTFAPDTVTFMDFRVQQQGDTRFVYVLPFSETEALVEFTLFSPALLPDQDYVAALAGYIRDFLKIEHYTIVEEEFGIIPMSDYPFTPLQTGKEIRIGTAGGFVKASSGYAFKRTQARARAFAADWAHAGHPNPETLRSPWRFRAYDAIFLRALSDNLIPAHSIFGHFFKNLDGYTVFRFLDEKSNFLEDIRALSAVPMLPFLKAAARKSTQFTKI